MFVQYDMERKKNFRVFLQHTTTKVERRCLGGSAKSFRFFICPLKPSSNSKELKPPSYANVTQYGQKVMAITTVGATVIVVL